MKNKKEMSKQGNAVGELLKYKLNCIPDVSFQGKLNSIMYPSAFTVLNLSVTSSALWDANNAKRESFHCYMDLQITSKVSRF